MQRTRVRPAQKGDFERESSSFTPEETGQPDPTPVPNIDNPVRAGSGLGPINQEGEGNRQNAELAELDEVEPTIDLDKPEQKTFLPRE